MANGNAISSIAQSSGGSLSSSLVTASQNVAPAEINILIASNRPYVQGFNAMGSKYNGNDNANANQEYRYNFTGYVFNTSNSTLSIQVKGIGASQFTTFSTPFNGDTVQSVAQTINTLGVGLFDTYTFFGDTYVSTHNDDNVYGDLTISSDIVSIQQPLSTEGGDPITAEDGDIITTEVSNTTIFPVEYIPQGDPALSITIQDTGPGGGGGGGGTTYSQVRNAFSQNNYEVGGVYLYSEDIQQLNNVIQYSSLDVDGTRQIINITNVLDPNQLVNSSVVDLSQFDGNIVFNGNSFISSSLAPFNRLQMKFLAKGINTNSEIPSNFLAIQEATNTKFFEPEGGDLSVFEKNEAEILDAIPEEATPRKLVQRLKGKIREDIAKQNDSVSTPIEEDEYAYKGEDVQLVTPQKQGGSVTEKENLTQILNNKYTPLVLLGVAAIVGMYFYTKKKKG
jgi:hypothetical protein